MGQSLKDFLNESLNEDKAPILQDSEPAINSGDECEYDGKKCTVQSVNTGSGMANIIIDGSTLEVEIAKLKKIADQEGGATVAECVKGDDVMYNEKKYKVKEVKDGKAMLTADGDYDDEDDIDAKDVEIVKESVTECQAGDTVTYDGSEYKVKSIKDGKVVLDNDEEVEEKDIKIVKESVNEDDNKDRESQAAYIVKNSDKESDDLKDLSDEDVEKLYKELEKKADNK